MIGRKRGGPGSPNNGSLSFADLLLSEALKESKSSVFSSVEPLARFDYDAEAALKQRCIREFWKAHHLPGVPDPMIRAPLPRFYRSTSKRRVLWARNGLSFLFGAQKANPGHLALSTLEPELHSDIFKFAHGELKDPKNQNVAKAMSHLIIRGTDRVVIVFNVRDVSGPIVRGLKIIAARIMRGFQCVAGCSVYVDHTGSPFYLEAKRPPRKEVGYKKLSGTDRLALEFKGRRVAFPATVFSQVNDEMLPVLIDKVVEMLEPRRNFRLLDLYSGYGLFSHFLFDTVGEIIGVDAEGPAIEAARENARNLGYQKRAFFLAGRVSASLLEKRFRFRDKMPEIAILDPPRQGTEEGVIKALAARRPVGVVHIFCGTDRLPPELRTWRKNGYQVIRAAPLDLFPGSPNIETLVLLKPSPGRSCEK